MWVKIDDRFFQHPKIVAVGPLGLALQVAGLCYCNQYMTDGFIPWGAARGLLNWEFLGPPEEDGKRLVWSIDIGCGMSGQPISTEFVIDLSVSAGIWEERVDGYLIHDYSDFQKGSDEIKQIKAARQEAGRIGGQAKRKQNASKHQAKDQAKSNPVPVPDPDPVPDPVPEPNKTREDVATPSRRDSSVLEKLEKSEHYDSAGLCDLLGTEVLKFKPSYKLGFDPTVDPGLPGGIPVKWLEDMERLLRIDKRNDERTAQLIRWACQHETDRFSWAENIRSPRALRRAWEKSDDQIRRD